MGRCRYPLQVETGERVYEIEADEEKTLGEVMTRAIPERRWEETLIHTTSGQTPNLRDKVGDVVRSLGDTRFRLSDGGDLGAVIPPFPLFLHNATQYSSNWQERIRYELKYITYLNNEVSKKNRNFSYITPHLYRHNGIYFVRGEIGTVVGSANFLVILSRHYPNVHPEVSIYKSNFISEYEKACRILNKHPHIYDENIDGYNIPAICGDNRYLSKWTGKKGIAHYCSDILFPWLSFANHYIWKVRR